MAARMADNTSEGEGSLDFEVDGSAGVLAFVGFASAGSTLEISESKDIRSAESTSVETESKLARGDAGEGGVPGVRFESLVQKESFEARVLAIGEVASESSELGVEVPESGELGEHKTSEESLKVFWVCKGVINLT